MKGPLQLMKKCLKEFIDTFKSKESLTCPTLFFGIATLLVSLFFFIALLFRLNVRGFWYFFLTFAFCIVLTFDFMFGEINSNKRHREIIEAHQEIMKAIETIESDAEKQHRNIIKAIKKIERY